MTFEALWWKFFCFLCLFLFEINFVAQIRYGNFAGFFFCLIPIIYNQDCSLVKSFVSLPYDITGLPLPRNKYQVWADIYIWLQTSFVYHSYFRVRSLWRMPRPWRQWLICSVNSVYVKFSSLIMGKRETY